MIKITVLFFANLRELVGKKEILFDIPEGTTIKEFKSLVAETYPELSQALETTLVSVNKEFGFDHEVLPAEAQVALFPPVSGG